MLPKYRIPVAGTQCSSALIYGAEDCAEISSEGLLVLSSHLILGMFEDVNMKLGTIFGGAGGFYDTNVM